MICNRFACCVHCVCISSMQSSFVRCNKIAATLNRIESNQIKPYQSAGMHDSWQSMFTPPAKKNTNKITWIEWIGSESAAPWPHISSTLVHPVCLVCAVCFFFSPLIYGTTGSTPWLSNRVNHINRIQTQPITHKIHNNYTN